MLYYIFDYLDRFNFPGAGLFNYISFRAAMALLMSLFVSVFIGKRIINKLRNQQIGETAPQQVTGGHVRQVHPDGGDSHGQLRQ